MRMRDFVSSLLQGVLSSPPFFCPQWWVYHNVQCISLTAFPSLRRGGSLFFVYVFSLQGKADKGCQVDGNCGTIK